MGYLLQRFGKVLSWNPLQLNSIQVLDSMLCFCFCFFVCACVWFFFVLCSFESWLPLPIKYLFSWVRRVNTNLSWCMMRWRTQHMVEAAALQDMARASRLQDIKEATESQRKTISTASPHLMAVAMIVDGALGQRMTFLLFRNGRIWGIASLTEDPIFLLSLIFIPISFPFFCLSWVVEWVSGWVGEWA